MSNAIPIRDLAGKIVGLQGTQAVDPVQAVLDASLKAVGATPPSEPTSSTVQIPQKPSWNTIATGVAVLSIAVLAMVFSSGRQSPVASTSLPTALLAPSPSKSTPIPSPMPVAKLPAFAAPNGIQLGEIEVTRAMTLVAHYESDWIQADVTGSGIVWLRAADWPALALIGPNLAPSPPAPQLGRGLEQRGGTRGGSTAADVAEPVATEQPAAMPTATIVWATSAPVNAVDFKQPSMNDTCKFIGCIGNNAVQANQEQACHALFWQYGDQEGTSIPASVTAAIQECIGKGRYH